jgi:hypothetical protein
VNGKRTIIGKEKNIKKKREQVRSGEKKAKEKSNGPLHMRVLLPSLLVQHKAKLPKHS